MERIENLWFEDMKKKKREKTTTKTIVRSKADHPNEQISFNY